MSQLKKRRTNGFGSGFADILVIVVKPYHQTMITAGWTVKSETETTATFDYSCRNRFVGDDESVVFELWGDLPETVRDHFRIDWDNSVY
jgi:hypothetical protein